MSNRGDPIQSGPLTRSGDKRKAYPTKAVKVAHLMSTRPGSSFNDWGQPPPPLPPSRAPAPAVAGGRWKASLTDATSNFGRDGADDWGPASVRRATKTGATDDTTVVTGC